MRIRLTDQDDVELLNSIAHGLGRATGRRGVTGSHKSTQNLVDAYLKPSVFGAHEVFMNSVHEHVLFMFAHDCSQKLRRARVCSRLFTNSGASTEPHRLCAPSLLMAE